MFFWKNFTNSYEFYCKFYHPFIKVFIFIDDLEIMLLRI